MEINLINLQKCTQEPEILKEKDGLNRLLIKSPLSVLFKKVEVCSLTSK